VFVIARSACERGNRATLLLGPIVAAGVASVYRSSIRLDPSSGKRWTPTRGDCAPTAPWHPTYLGGLSGDGSPSLVEFALAAVRSAGGRVPLGTWPSRWTGIVLTLCVPPAGGDGGGVSCSRRGGAGIAAWPVCSARPFSSLSWRTVAVAGAVRTVGREWSCILSGARWQMFLNRPISARHGRVSFGSLRRPLIKLGEEGYATPRGHNEICSSGTQGGRWVSPSRVALDSSAPASGPGESNARRPAVRRRRRRGIVGYSVQTVGFKVAHGQLFFYSGPAVRGSAKPAASPLDWSSRPAVAGCHMAGGPRFFGAGC